MKGSFLTGNSADLRKKIPCAIKVIPFFTDQHQHHHETESTSLESVYREVFITKAMSDLAGDRGLAFIHGYKFSVVKGAFSETLLQAWDEWSTSNPKNSENPRPGKIF